MFFLPSVFLLVYFFILFFFFVLLFGLCRWMGKSWEKKIEKIKKNFEKTKRKKNLFKVYGFVFSSSNDRCICLCCFDNPAIVRYMLASASKSANWRQTASKTQRLAVDSFNCWMRNQILDISLFADVIIRQRNWIGDWWSSGWFIAWIFFWFVIVLIVVKYTLNHISVISTTNWHFIVCVCVRGLMPMDVWEPAKVGLDHIISKCKH